MKTLGFIVRTASIAFVRLCRRQGLAVMLFVLCTALPLCVAPAAQEVLSREAVFDGIHLAITAPEGDSTPQLLEELLSNMKDVSKYCRISAMDATEAQDALFHGQVTAILSMPENFIQGILAGTNPEVMLIVSPEHPLQSLLTLWVGQSATDLLAAFQSSIHTVLTAYNAAPPSGLSYEDVVSQINLRCIRWTLQRQDLFTVETISVTGRLPIGFHYSLSVFLFLLLSSATIFAPVYSVERIGSMQRYLAAGQHPYGGYAGFFCGCWLFSLCLTLPGVLLLTKGNFLSALFCAIFVSLFTTGFGSVFCLICPDNSQGCLWTFLLSFGMLGISGGILPPAMLPVTLRKLTPCSPITWLRQILAWCGGYGHPDGNAILAALICAIVLVCLGGVLFRNHLQKEVHHL